MSFPGGLDRNLQCLRGFGIPLYLRHAATLIHGNERVEAVMMTELDEDGQPIVGSEKLTECDTLIPSVTMRDFFSTVRVSGGKTPLLSVRSRRPVPKEMLMPCTSDLATMIVPAPVKIGDTIIKDILNLSVDIIAARDVEEAGLIRLTFDPTSAPFNCPCPAFIKPLTFLLGPPWGEDPVNLPVAP